MGPRESERCGTSIYSHFATILVIASDGIGKYTYFDGCDAKTALE